MKNYIKILIFLAFLIPTTKVWGATYYIDCVNGNNANTGLGTTSALAWADLDQFTDNARSAGDVAYVRRGGTGCDNGTDLTFTSDGTLNNPIIMSADYDNLWSDFATSSQTYTPVFGSKTMEASANITGIAAGDWIYVYGDQTENYNSPTIYGKDFTYEVASVSGTTLTLQLPYKGNQSGSGNSLRVLPDAPAWNTTAGDFQWLMNGDHYWTLQGIDNAGTDANCQISAPSSVGLTVIDMIFRMNGASDCGIEQMRRDTQVSKSRFHNFAILIEGGTAATSDGNLTDVLVDCNNVASSIAFRTSGIGGNGYLKNVEIVNCTNDFSTQSNVAQNYYYLSNVKRNANFNGISGDANVRFFTEDDFGTVGVGSHLYSNMSANNAPTTTVATTTNLRSGGGAKNIAVFPPSGTGNTGISTKIFPWSFIKLFEYGFYSDGTSKTYTIYLNSTSTAQWTNDPTASELWVECEYYGHATNAERQIKKSTGVVDFNGSTSWQTLSVTCDPVQAGILYLRAWYGKPRETPTNMFYLDLTPIVS